MHVNTGIQRLTVLLGFIIKHFCPGLAKRFQSCKVKACVSQRTDQHPDKQNRRREGKVSSNKDTRVFRS